MGRWLERRSLETIVFLLLFGPMPVAIALSVPFGTLPLGLWCVWIVLIVAAL